MMEYVTIKNSNLRVSRICMGGCPMGCYGWGEVSEKALSETVSAALDSGINFFDTADTYGLGKSEEILGKALRGKRNHAIIATKFGVRISGGKTFYDNSSEWIETAVRGSLERLGTDCIDLYQLHYRDGKTPLAEVIGTLDGLREQGLIKYYGLSNIRAEDMDEIRENRGSFVSFQDEYSLACRKNEKDIFELAYNLDMTPFTWGSLGQGILSGKYDKNVTFSDNDRRSRDVYVNFHGEKLLKNLEIVEVLRKIATERGCSVPAVALRFILDYINDSIVLVGMKTVNNLYDNMEASGWRLSEEQIKLLEKISG